MISAVTVRVPATTANLGPGFDTLALALDLWNEAVFEPAESGLSIAVEGEGMGILPLDRTNLVLKAVEELCLRLNQPVPGLAVRCSNQIPLGSGLGSSAAATLLGLLGANAVLGAPLRSDQILEIAIELEGHPDNAAAAINGGLVVISGLNNHGWLVRRYDIPALSAALVLPDFDFPTHAARAALPKQVPFADAVFNMGRVLLVVDALRTGDLDLLGKAMEDRLHQPYRLPLIPRAAEAMAAARAAGAAAIAISGAGPSVIAFTAGDPAQVGFAMADEFRMAGIPSRTFNLTTVNCGAEWNFS
jgi:homoserine kinase